jgi:hypothetical protein
MHKTFVQSFMPRQQNLIVGSSGVIEANKQSWVQLPNSL